MEAIERPARDPAKEERTLLEEMGTHGRIALGVATALAPVSFVAALVVALFGAIAQPNVLGIGWPGVALAVLIYSLVWTGLLLALYAPHLMQSRSVPAYSRPMWAIAFLCLAPFVLPFYFYVHVWRERGDRDGWDPSAHPYAEPRGRIVVTDVTEHA